MRIAYSLVLLVVLAGVALVAYVRLAPSDPARWHVVIDGEGDADFAYGARRVIDAGDGTLAAADAYMRSLPRTQVLAGSVGDGRITYVTRTQMIGFPDYTTVELSGGKLKAFARLRFGGSDFGVNRDRLEGLLAALKGG